MICFTIFFRNVFNVRDLLLENEPDLGCNTEIGRADEDHFLKHCVFGEFVSILYPGVKFLVPHHIQVHHVAYIQIENPVELVFNAQRTSHIELVDLLVFKLL